MMNLSIQNKNIYLILKGMRTTFRIIADTLYLLMFVSLTVLAILQTTEFNIPWRELALSENIWCQIVYTLLFSPQIFLAVLVAVQYLCAEHYDWKDYLLALMIAGIIFQMTDTNGGSAFQSYVLLALGARNFSFRFLAKIYFVISSGIVLLTVVASQIGWIENLIYSARSGRVSFGFIYPTDCAAHLLFLALIYWYLRGSKLRYPELLAFLGLGGISWFGCKGRFTTVLLLMIIIISAIYIFFWHRAENKYNWNIIWEDGVLKWLVSLPLLCSLSIHIVSIIYSDKNLLLHWFDGVLNQRLSLAKRGIDIYGFRLLGSDIPMIGNGGNTEIPSKYYYIDSSFLQISMLYGIAALGVVMLLFLLAGWRAYKNKEWILLLVLGVVALHALFEHHAFDLAYSPFLFAAFARNGQLHGGSYFEMKRLIQGDSKKTG